MWSEYKGHVHKTHACCSNSSLYVYSSLYVRKCMHVCLNSYCQQGMFLDYKVELYVGRSLAKWLHLLVSWEHMQPSICNYKCLCMTCECFLNAYLYKNIAFRVIGENYVGKNKKYVIVQMLKYTAHFFPRFCFVNHLTVKPRLSRGLRSKNDPQ